MDLIERQAAIDAIMELIEARNRWNSDARGEIKGLDAAYCAIEDLPTADVVERKHGKWMKHNDKACWHCSECKEDNYYAYSWNSNTGKYEFQDHYCPNCGAEMKGEDDGLD